MKGSKDEVRIPDVEIVISAAGSDVGVVAFYFPTNPHKQIEVLTTVVEASAASHLVALLHQAIASLNGEDWYTVDELAAGLAEEENEPPF